MTAKRALALGVTLLCGCVKNDQLTPKDAHGGESLPRDLVADTASGGWPDIKSVTDVALPQGARAAAYVVW